MDSREPPPHPPHMMIGPNSYPSAMISPTTARFPFINNPSEPITTAATTSPSDSLKPCGFASESAKKKRGRPRKYSPDGNIALGLAPTHAPSSSSAEPMPKKNRGRPPGSGKKQMDALGIGGTGFTPHVVLVDSGEDIAAKIMAFCQQGPRTICILSANGAVGSVSFRQPAVDGGTVSYQGKFEIISLTGSLPVSEDSSGRNRVGGLNVSLAGADGRVMGGGVTGALTAASAVQVIVGSFIADRKKSSSNNLKSGPSTTTSSQMLNFGAPTTPTSPTSQGHSSDSSDENENAPYSKGPVLYHNVGQPIHSMPMYHHQLWAGQNHQ